MIDLGDTLTLTWTTAQGAPATGPVVLTLTMPDGTTATPAVTGPVSGTWSASYVTVQAGHHRAAWSGGGQGYTDAFDVDAASTIVRISSSCVVEVTFRCAFASARDTMPLEAASTSKASV